MKRKFYRSCVAVLLSMVMIFGGVHIGAAADGGIVPFGFVPPTLPVSFSVSAPQSVMAKGDTQQLTYSRDPIGGTLTWSSSNNSVATVDSAGKVTAVATGNVTITGRYVYDGTAKTSSVSIQVLNPTLGIKNATEYYIMNYQSKRLMGIQTASNSNNTNVHTGNINGSTCYKWETELYAGNYTYQLKNSFSLTGKTLNVTGSNLDIYADNNGNNQQFFIQRINNKESPYDGLYLIKNGDQFVAQDSNYNVCLVSEKNSACYWSFMAE